VKYLLTIFLSTFFFVLTYVSAPADFTSIDQWILACLLTGVFAVQILIARMFVRYRIVQNIILAGFATINILYVNLALNSGFLGLSIYVQMLLLLLALFIIATLMNIVDENPRFSRVLPAFFMLAIAGVLVQTLFSAAPIPVVSTEHGKISAENIRIVDFKTKPNVYFISFDAMIPKVLLQMNLGLETTPYHEVLDTHFRRFRNFFADRVWTRKSLNSLLSLDIGHFSKAERSNTARYFFAGWIPSPLLEIFKHNGYETTTHYSSLYFGLAKGPHVDNYNTQMTSWEGAQFGGVCEFIETNGYKVLIFMGYCKLIKSWKYILAVRALGLEPLDGQMKKIDFLIDHMRGGLEKDVPQIFVAYLFSPGHTAPSFKSWDKVSFDEFKQVYLKGSEKTAEYLTKIVNFIANEDPKAILYVFGDHGMWLSRYVTFEHDGTFFVQDRYGVYGGIHPRERCEESFDTPYNHNFMTISQGAHMIIRCLSGGKNAFLTLENYRLPKLKTKDHEDYEDYLYE